MVGASLTAATVVVKEARVLVSGRGVGVGDAEIEDASARGVLVFERGEGLSEVPPPFLAKVFESGDGVGEESLVLVRL